MVKNNFLNNFLLILNNSDPLVAEDLNTEDMAEAGEVWVVMVAMVVFMVVIRTCYIV